jgi:twitching motility protein PilJ
MTMAANDSENGVQLLVRESASRSMPQALDDKAPPRFVLPLIGHLPVARQVPILGIVLLVLLAGVATLMVLDRRQSAYASAYLSTANEMQMLSQRLVSAAQQAVHGAAPGFTQLGEARERFGRALTLLSEGGDHGSVSLPPSPAHLQGLLQELKNHWQSAERNVVVILGQRTALIEARNGKEAAASEHTSPPWQAAREISVASERLLENSRELAAAYQYIAQTHNEPLLGAVALSALALVCLLFIGRIVVDDAEHRAFESKRAAAANERANQQTQDAILRLLDEMGSLAQGDLTVRANIGDEVTGAIADSVNFAVDELRRLVTGINDATTEVAAASSQAQLITSELLGAAQRQSREISDTGSAITALTSSITQVSERAAQSALVASQSLSAASQGASAVRHAIEGMDNIREQIQETAKRIKRLAESSQEIGAIVDLIADITEQTNVLALNAAIQATSAGSAGRGFTLVAEEVQRLAERSAGATKQISAIVKTIQSDTQDAIAAMEQSTQGVVEHTRLADGAGRALVQIDEVSRRLATLIGEISAVTNEQTQSAERISRTMQEILRITELTTDGTRRTADSTERLAAMAARLKQSVAGFKLS